MDTCPVRRIGLEKQQFYRAAKSDDENDIARSHHRDKSSSSRAIVPHICCSKVRKALLFRAYPAIDLQNIKLFKSPEFFEIMDIKSLITTIESSPAFQETIQKFPEQYLTHIFTIMDSRKAEEWDVGYYSKKTDRIIVFKYANNTVTAEPPQEVFKEKGYVEPLVLDAVTIGKDEAIAQANAVLKENYSAESIMNAIVLLQNIKEYGQVWNITLTTLTFHVINVKINAITGEVVKHSRESLIGWNKK